MRERKRQNDGPDIVQRDRRACQRREVGDLSGTRNPACKREIGMDDVGRLVIEKRREAADHFELLARKDGNAPRPFERNPGFGIRNVQRIFEKERIHCLHCLRDGGGARRIELVMAMRGNVNLVSDGLTAIGVRARHLAQLRPVKRSCEAGGRNAEDGSMLFLKALKPSGICLMRCAQPRHEDLSSMSRPMPWQYIGMASRNGPPSPVDCRGAVR